MDDASRARLRILVVEDNRDMAANIGDYLESKGHTVDFAMVYSRTPMLSTLFVYSV